MLKCLNPFKKFMNGIWVPLPCGQCPFCRQKKSAEWALRLELESRVYTDIAFITLTYSPEFIPENYSLVPSHLSSFVKRLRRHLDLRYSNPYKIRFFGCGEYGDRRSRPHYHLMIFGLKPCDFPLINKSWDFGLIDIQIPRDAQQVSSYVGAYVSKKQPRVFYGKDRFPPFHRQSKGLGWSYVQQFPVFTPVIRKGNIFRYIGRYLTNKLAEKFGFLEEWLEKTRESLVESALDIYSMFALKFDWFDEIYQVNPCLAIKKAFPAYYSGDLELLLQRQKIFVRKDL